MLELSQAPEGAASEDRCDVQQPLRNTFLSGFRLPWPPSGCLDELTPFVVSDERAFRHLNLAFGSSRIASSAYQKWPTSNGAFKCPRSTK